MIESKNIIISFIIGLMVNILSFYLLTLNIINILTFVFIIIGFILIILIIGIQARYNELKKEVEQINVNYKKIEENFKINKRLTKLELWREQYAKKK